MLYCKVVNVYYDVYENKIIHSQMLSSVFSQYPYSKNASFISYQLCHLQNSLVKNKSLQ